MKHRIGMVALVGGLLASGLGGPLGAQEQLAFAAKPRFIATWVARGAPDDASGAAVLQRRITLDLTDVPVATALREIARQARLDFTYNKSLLAKRATVSLHARDLTVVAALTEVLINAGLDVAVGRTGALALVKRAAPPVERTEGEQARTIAGIVVTERGGGIPAASVLLLNPATRAVTDQNGRFRFDATTGPEITLSVTAIGYRPNTVQITGRSDSLRIVLVEAPVNLDALVVTGTVGSAQRRSIGNSIVSLQVADAAELSGANDIGKLINGRAPGVLVMPASGRVGSGPQINIRGRSTLSLNNQPLVYIDGIRVVNDIGTGSGQQGAQVISRLSDVSPEAIEKIEIIKGPAAATIYGTEAANGVIQIITKRGQAGKPQFTVSTRQGFNWFMDADGRIGNTYARDPQSGQILEWDPVAQEDARGTPIWQKGGIQGYNLALSGGTGPLAYYLSTAFDREAGMEPNNRSKRFGGHLNVNVAATSRIDVAGSLNIVRNKVDLGQDAAPSVLWGALFGSPLLVNGPRRGFSIAPPEIYYSDAFDNFQDVARFTASLTVDHRPTDWFKHRLAVGWDQTGEDNQSLTRFMTPDQAQFFTATQAQGSLLNDRRDIAYTTVDYNGTATFPLSSDLSSSSSVGAQYYRRRTNFVSVNARGFPAPGLSTAAAAAVVTGSQDYVTNATAGVYFQQQFAFKQRVYLTGALRVDNNSAFGENFDLAAYPKVSATWVVSDEPFLPKSWLNALKLRAAFGASGQQPETFAALRTYRPTTGPGDASIITPQFVGNPDLKPERGEELELGFEAGLFDRLGIDFTYYNKKVKDAILLRDVAPSGGFPGQQFVNVGAVRNHGMEVQLTAQAISSRKLALDIGLSLATASDEVEDLGDVPFLNIGASSGVQRQQVGFPIGGFFVKRVVSADLDATGKAVNILCDGGTGRDGVEPGGTPVACASAPRVFIGTPTPKYSGAGSITATIGGRLRLYGLVDFKSGHRIFDWNNFVQCVTFLNCEAVFRPEKYDPKYIAQVQTGGTFEQVEAFIPKASFAKLRELSATYAFPDRWAAKLGASRVSLSVAGRNLHTWTNYTTLDPESAFTQSTVWTLDFLRNPQLAQFVTTLSVTF